MLSLCRVLDYNAYMNQQTIQGLLRRQPFQPFEIRMSSGDRFEMRHPEMAILLQSNVVWDNPESDDFGFCALPQIADAKTLPAGRPDCS